MARSPSRMPTYRSWANMWSRCANQNDPYFAIYGGRGVTICARWRVYENFLADMGERPDGLTLDRIDNNKGYSIKNCRWADRKVQSQNRSCTVWITLNGKTQCASAWCREYQMSSALLSYRVRSGLSYADALQKPIARKKAYKSRRKVK